MEKDVSPKAGRILTNTALSVLSWGIPLALAFFSTPIIVRGLGTEQYGIYAVILGFLGYTFTTGIGKVAGKYIPEYRAARDAQKLSQAVSATFWITLAVGSVQAAALAAAAPWIASNVLLLSPDTSDFVVKALYLAAFTGFALMVSQVFQFSLQGLHRFDLYSLITNVNAVLSAGGNVWLVLNGYGVLGLLVWNATITSITGLLFYLKLRPLLPEWGISFDINREMIRSAAKYAGSIFIYQTLTSILFVFERTWIVRKFGAEELSFYVIPMMLALYMHSLVASFAQVLFPVVNELLSDRERLKRLYLRATKIIVAIAVFIAASYAGIGETFLGLWISPEFGKRSFVILVILSLAFFFNIVSMTAWMVAEVFKAPGLNALSSTIWTAAAIPLMIFCSKYWQAEGAALGRLAGVLLTLPLVLYIEKRFLESVNISFWAGLILRLFPAAAAAVLIERYFFGESYSWANLFLGFLSGSAVFALMLLITGFISREDRAMIRARLPRWRSEAAS